MEKKKTTKFIIIITVLIVILLGMSGYIIYDKILNKSEERKEESIDSKTEYIESFKTDEYIDNILHSLDENEHKFTENIIIYSIFDIMRFHDTNDKYFESFPISDDFDLSSYITNSVMPVEVIKEMHNSIINYISKNNLNELTQKLFNYDFSTIENKFVETLNSDSLLNLFGEYDDGYIFAFGGAGGHAYSFENASIETNNDLRVYNYDVYCSLYYNSETTDTSSRGAFEDTKIGEIEITSKYDKELESFVLSEYTYNIDEKIDISSCFVP